jgi:hypothetical protein
MPITIHGDGFITGLGNVSTSGNVTGSSVVVSSGVTFSDGASQTAAAIGHGQTWRDVTASRAKTTTYTNSTGKPIQVSVNVNLQGTTQSSNSLTVDGLVVGYQTQNTAGVQSGITSQLTAVIPAGSTYNITGSGTITSWFELR